MKEFYISKEKYEELIKEMENYLKIERPNIIKAIQEAKSLGDLSENAEYHSAKERQNFIENRISELEMKIRSARILDGSNFREDVIVIGAKVTMKDLVSGEEVQYTLVAQDDADYTKNKVSDESPIGKAILGKRVNENILVKSPNGLKKYSIMKIEKGF